MNSLDLPTFPEKFELQSDGKRDLVPMDELIDDPNILTSRILQAGRWPLALVWSLFVSEAIRKYKGTNQNDAHQLELKYTDELGNDRVIEIEYLIRDSRVK